MKKKSKKTLHRCLLSAISYYNPDLHEEQGGFILKVPKQDHYEFVPITNKLTGTSGAAGLYIAEQAEFDEKVQLRSFDEDLDIFASFHTHPIGMRAMPSSIDINMLFTSFPINFIYAHNKELNRFDFNPQAKPGEFKWRYTNVMLFNGFTPQDVSTRFTLLNKPHELTWLNLK
jgi:proteasome lid subunit RPN8/RPN11